MKGERTFYVATDLIVPFGIKDIDKFREKLISEKQISRAVKLTKEGRSMFKSATVSFFETKLIEASLQVDYETPFYETKVSTFSLHINLTEKELKDFRSVLNTAYVCCKSCMNEENDCYCTDNHNDIFEGDADICAICQGGMSTENRETVCSHEFHTSCMLKHLKSKRKNECPMCRQTLLREEDLFD